MPLSEFLRQRLQAYTDNTVPALLITGGSVVMGWLIHTYGPVWGLDRKVALVLAWVVALAVALGLSALLKPKDPNEVEKHRLEPLVPPINVNIENKPVFENKVDQRPINYQTQSQAQSQSNLITQNTAVSPEVECVGCYFAQNMLSHWNLLGEVTGRPCRAALADFYLKPIPGADPWLELRTHLVFYCLKGTQLQRVRDGMWSEQGNVIQMPMNTGDTRTLVIAIEFDDIGFNTYEYHEEPSNRPRFTTTGIYYHFLKPTLTPLNENSLKVKVSVTGKYMDRVTLHKDFWFNLRRPEMVIERIVPPEESGQTVETAIQSSGLP